MSEVKTLLIVDDSQTSRQILRNRFSKQRKGWRIFDSDNGADAVEMAQVIKADYVTMDVNMPNMSGLEAAERINAHSPGIKIVLITANIQDAVRVRAEEMGYGFVEKPIDDSSIPKALEFFEGSAGHV